MEFTRYLPIWVSAVLGGSLLAFVVAAGPDRGSEVDSISTPALAETESIEAPEPAENIIDEPSAPAQDAEAAVMPQDSFSSGLLDYQDLIRGRISDRVRDLTERP